MQVIVSGKLRAQRAKSMKFKDGYMISSGQPVKEYIDSAVRHVLLRQVSSVLSQMERGLNSCLRIAFLWVLLLIKLLSHFLHFTGCFGYQGQDHARLGS